MEADGFSLDDKTAEDNGKRHPRYYREMERDEPIRNRQLVVSEVEPSAIRNSSLFPPHEIRAKYDLSISRYKEIEHKEIVYEKPDIIIEKVMRLEKEIENDIKAIKSMVQ